MPTEQDILYTEDLQDDFQTGDTTGLTALESGDLVLEKASQTPVNNLIVDANSGNVSLLAGTYEYNTVHVKDNQTLFINGSVTIKAIHVLVDTGSSINGSGRSQYGRVTSAYAHGQGPGAGRSYTNGGGAGHGGVGGYSSGSTTTGGPSYGDASTDEALEGSSGAAGIYTYAYGGAGGSALTLFTEIFDHNGHVLLNGENGGGAGFSYGGGGGSAGTFLLFAKTWNRNAYVYLQGGAADKGGGGAGGRLKIRYETRSNDNGYAFLQGGAGFAKGGNGTANGRIESYASPYPLAYASAGSRSHAISIDSIDSVESSSISWTETKPAGTAIDVLVSLDGNLWTAATNGEPIPGIQPGDDLTGQTLYYRQVFTTTDGQVTPELHDFQVEIVQSTGAFYETAVTAHVTPLHSTVTTAKNQDLHWLETTQVDLAKGTLHNTMATPDGQLTLFSAVPRPANDLIVDSASGDVTLQAGTYEYHKIRIKEGKRLYINGHVTIKATEFVVEAGSFVDGSGRSDYPRDVMTANGAGPGGGTTGTNYGAGAGHGGKGGSAVDGSFVRNGGTIYGPTEPYTITQGSHGGNGGRWGAKGGAALAVTAGTVETAGTVYMFGDSGSASYSEGGGAGSGGGILIRTKNWTHTGLLDARGGSAQYSESKAGSGGGGRIKVYYESKTGSGNFNVTGGKAQSVGTITAGADGELLQVAEPYSLPVFTGYPLQGTRLQAYLLSMAGTVRNSVIRWNADTPPATSLLVEASFDGTTWQPVANGDPIPGVAFGDDLWEEPKTFYTRTTLSTTDTQLSPALQEFEVQVVRFVPTTQELDAVSYLRPVTAAVAVEKIRRRDISVSSFVRPLTGSVARQASLSTHSFTRALTAAAEAETTGIRIPSSGISPLSGSADPHITGIRQVEAHVALSATVQVQQVRQLTVHSDMQPVAVTVERHALRNTKTHAVIQRITAEVQAQAFGGVSIETEAFINPVNTSVSVSFTRSESSYIYVSRISSKQKKSVMRGISAAATLRPVHGGAHAFRRRTEAGGGSVARIDAQETHTAQRHVLQTAYVRKLTASSQAHWYRESIAVHSFMRALTASAIADDSPVGIAVRAGDSLTQIRARDSLTWVGLARN